MHKVNQHIRRFLIIIFVFGISELYIIFSERIYEIRSEIMIERNQIEAPEYLGDLGSNRWIWIRNGLATKESILSDYNLSKILKENPHIIHQKQNQSENLKSLRNSIEINFKGADIYAFNIRIRSKDIEAAIMASNSIISSITNYELIKPITTYKNTIENLKNNIEKLKIEERQIQPNLQRNNRKIKSINDEIDRMERTLHQIKIATILLEAEGKTRINIIEEPKPPPKPIWPKDNFLRLISLLVSLVIILITEKLFGATYS